MRVTKALTGTLISRIGLWVSLIAATAVRLPHLDFVPIWDGRCYWDDCIAPALGRPFDPLAFNCIGHRSMLYMLSVIWPQYFDRGSTLLLNLAHLGMALLIVWGFYRVIARLLPPGESGTSGLPAALVTLLFACMPVWTAASLNLNPDTGVLAGFLFAVSFALRRKVTAAVLAGFFLVLSKEIGLLLWIVIALVETVAAIHEAGRKRAARIVLGRWSYALPPIAYAAVGWALRAKGMSASWAGAAPPSQLIGTFLTVDFGDPVFAAYVADLTVLNFAWVMTAVLVVWLGAVLFAVLKKRPAPLAPELNRGAAAVAGVIGLAALYLCTRFPTFNNARYLLPAIAAMTMAFGVATVSLLRSTAARTTLFLVAAALQLASMWRTIDPISKAAFGTFHFGEREMLSMTSLTNECCGHGRDQLVYNMQFTAFHYAQNDLLRRIAPGPDDVVAYSILGRWYPIGRIDARTHQRTLRADGSYMLHEVTFQDLLERKVWPRRLHYLAYPNYPNGPELDLFSRFYAITGPYEAGSDGYTIHWYELRH